ncbi:MAG: hypothetical protein KIY12_00180 [Thermoplasmata archaeon]|uniref:Hydrogenase n=1 Tax=Candidatus Sysuiplasma superficiale TaxID=2823368 RepID=A0A8J8C9Z5_9ARCH|nr:hypothetical protein [Candidatus Sysuiplasma superficiale]MBX8643140.1 hypothetical protein [Candidatus Sysuiplasma superficiale]MCL4346928.1 hypothetical protein [Candidatus Thermoplasmatota archaeon]
MSNEALAILGVLIIVSALSIQVRSYIRPAVLTVTTQSVLLAFSVAYLGLVQKSAGLILLAFLIFILRGYLLTRILERKLPVRKMFVREYSHEAATVTVASAVLLIVSFLTYRFAIYPAIGDPLGSIGFAVMLQGFLLVMSRRNSFAHVIGYIEEENGVIFMSLSVAPLPLLIEISVLLDVLALVIVSAVLVRQDIVHGSVEDLIG